MDITIFGIIEIVCLIASIVGLVVSVVGVQIARANLRVIQRARIGGLIGSIARSNLAMQIIFVMYFALWAWMTAVSVMTPPTPSQVSAGTQTVLFYLVLLATLSIMASGSAYLQIVYQRRRRSLMPPGDPTIDEHGRPLGPAR